MAALKVPTEVRSTKHDFRWTGRKRLNNDPGVIDTTHCDHRSEENESCAGQYLWPSMCGFISVQRRYTLQLAAGRRNPEQVPAHSRRVHRDVAVRTPRGAA